MASPHPEAELTFHGMWKKRLVRVFQNSIEPRKFPLTVGLSAMLQRSHTRRCGYNLPHVDLGDFSIDFKGATPEGARWVESFQSLYSLCSKASKSFSFSFKFTATPTRIFPHPGCTRPLN